MTKYKYIIGSGWWATEEVSRKVNPKRNELGDSFIRSVDFFELWLKSVQETSEPSDIVVVDSAAPVKPAKQLADQVRWIELPFNAKHSTDHIGQWSGWTRSVLASGHYASVSEADYFVYVEQDCLLKGKGIIEFCISKMTGDFMFGSGAGTPQPLQQSFFIIKKRRLASFLHNLATLEGRDCDLSPEWKFVWATWRPFVILANLGVFRVKRVRNLALKLAKARLFDFLPVGSGRARPIPFGEAFYYFQHGSLQEVEQHGAG